jgi:hypothetical protein
LIQRDDNEVKDCLVVAVVDVARMFRRHEVQAQAEETAAMIGLERRGEREGDL